MMQQSFAGMHANSCIEPTTVDNLINSFVNMTFANTGELEDEKYPATISEIASEQRKDKKLKRYFNKHVEVDPKDRILAGPCRQMSPTCLRDTWSLK